MAVDNENEILRQIIEDLPTGDVHELHRPVMLVSLLDVARPAKAKGTTDVSLFYILRCEICLAGVAKDFEVIRASGRVIIIEEEEAAPEEDDWKCIHAEETQHMKRKCIRMHFVAMGMN